MTIPTTTDATLPAFQNLNLAKPILKALTDLGYETPSPIQAKIIPFVLAGRDVLGQAQTGTGKTAAFALPLLSQLDLKKLTPQVLVLAPTRELAIQVAEAFHRYAAHMPGFHVMPIYGGQDYQTQLKQLKRGVHVVVGTPGRVMDHMRRGTLKLDGLRCLVLDEADEMLRMGFIEDVEWVLQQTPSECQIALFSATMPEAIRRIAKKHLKDPEQVTIKVRTPTAETIRQRYWLVNNIHKLDALTRILEAEDFDGIIIFVRTKTATLELAEKLAARGYAVAPLSGDIPQSQRTRTVERLKNGELDIVVATDVAARGLDVQRISHVINYDIPADTESYVHRIGRTGRAGRAGEAILFVAPREKRMLAMIEKATRQTIELMQLPSTQLINDQRVARFMQRITDTLAEKDCSLFAGLLAEYQQAQNVPAIDIAAALAVLLQGDTPFFIKNKPEVTHSAGVEKSRSGRDRDAPRRKTAFHSDEGLENFRIEVGRDHGVKPSNIVGAIANETGLSSKQIGQIEIFSDHSIVGLPGDMPREILEHLKKVWVANQQLKISKVKERPAFKNKKPGRGKSDRKRR